MTFEEYQKESRKTAIYPALYPDQRPNIVYPTLGLTGEAGEVAEKVKKILRDEKGAVSEEKRAEIAKELGDVLWYIAQLATELDLSLGEIARLNLEKLASRKDREKLSGSGDNR